MKINSVAVYVASQLNDILMYLVPSLPTDLVFVCGDKVNVCLHQAIMATMSPFLRDMLCKVNSTAQEVMLEQDSRIVKKLLKLVYTGKTTAKQEDMESLQCLLDSLGMGQAVYIEHEEGAADDAFNEIKPMESEIESDYDDLKQVVEVTDVPTSSYFSCPLCDKEVRFKVKLLKHMVDEHYYEELETALVGDFCQSSVCCGMNFSKSGFGQFIRHKVDKHRAVQEVATEEVREYLDSDMVDRVRGRTAVCDRLEVVICLNGEVASDKNIVSRMESLGENVDIDDDSERIEDVKMTVLDVKEAANPCEDKNKRHLPSKHKTEVIPVPFGQTREDQSYSVLVSYCGKMSSSSILGKDKQFLTLWNQFMVTSGPGAGFLHLPFLVESFVEMFGLTLARHGLSRQFLQHLLALQQSVGGRLDIRRVVNKLRRMDQDGGSLLL